MKIGIVGTGYVGLVTGVMLTSIGHEIVCVDNDLGKVHRLSQGDPIIYEDGLENLMKEAIRGNKIIFSSNYSDLNSCDSLFICVGTPSKEDGSANLSFVEEAVKNAARNVDRSSLIIIKSTVPPGTCRHMQKSINDLGYNHKIASNPEFLREGSAIFDFSSPDRLVFGTSNPDDIVILKQIYQPQIEKNVEVVETDTTTAEMIKYTSNSFLAIKLSFINEMANLCEYVDADIEKLAKGVGLDKRIGELFLNAGPGYGGSCFPKDTSALSMLAASYNCKSEILDSAIKSNISRYSLMKDKIKSILGNKRNIAVLGIAFKANTDDIRKSPAVEIVKLLLKEGFEISVFDPAALRNFAKLNLPRVTIASSSTEASLGKDAIVILTEWEEFKKIDWQIFAGSMKNKVVIDFRKVADEWAVKKAGFKYFTIGRKHD